jgi:hypothetical protein
MHIDIRDDISPVLQAALDKLTLRRLLSGA